MTWRTQVARTQSHSYAAINSTDKSLKLYPGTYHDLLNDAGKETVRADITGWIRAHASA